jgi:hypothetical protein
MEVKELVAKIITTKLRVEELRLQKRIILEELYKYCLDAERPMKKRKRGTPKHV